MFKIQPNNKTNKPYICMNTCELSISAKLDVSSARFPKQQNNNMEFQAVQ